MDSYLGEIKMFTGNFAPTGWLFCQGQLLLIQNYSALFTLLGTRYGGNGTTNFGLPDLQSRLPVGAGQGAGLSAYTQGQKGGTESVTLQANNMPQHTHTMPNIGMNCYSGIGNSDVPFNNYPAWVPGIKMYTSTMAAGANMPTLQTGTLTSSAGASSPTPINLIQPVLGTNFIICVNGLYPFSTI